MLVKIDYKQCPDGIFSNVVSSDAELAGREVTDFFKVLDADKADICYVAADILPAGIFIHLETVCAIAPRKIVEMQNDFERMRYLLTRDHGDKQLFAGIDLMKRSPNYEKQWMKFISLFGFKIFSCAIIAVWEGNENG